MTTLFSLFPCEITLKLLNVLYQKQSSTNFLVNLLIDCNEAFDKLISILLTWPKHSYPHIKLQEWPRVCEFMNEHIDCAKKDSNVTLVMKKHGYYYDYDADDTKELDVIMSDFYCQDYSQRYLELIKYFYMILIPTKGYAKDELTSAIVDLPYYFVRKNYILWTLIARTLVKSGKFHSYCEYIVVVDYIEAHGSKNLLDYHSGRFSERYDDLDEIPSEQDTEVGYHDADCEIYCCVPTLFYGGLTVRSKDIGSYAIFDYIVIVLLRIFPSFPSPQTYHLFVKLIDFDKLLLSMPKSLRGVFIKNLALLR